MQKNSPQTSRNCFYFFFKFKIGLSLNCPKLTLSTLTKMTSGIPDDYEERFGSISTFYPHLTSILSTIQCFIPISAFYLHFSVLSSFQRFVPISAFHPHFSVLSPFQFPFSVSVSAIQFQRFIPTRRNNYLRSFRYKRDKMTLPYMA